MSMEFCFKSYLYWFMIWGGIVCVCCWVAMCSEARRNFSSGPLGAYSSETGLPWIWGWEILLSLDPHSADLQLVPCLLGCDAGQHNYGASSLNHCATSPAPHCCFWFAFSWTKDFEHYCHVFFWHFFLLLRTICFVHSLIRDGIWYICVENRMSCIHSRNLSLIGWIQFHEVTLEYIQTTLKGPSQLSMYIYLCLYIQTTIIKEFMNWGEHRVSLKEKKGGIELI